MHKDPCIKTKCRDRLLYFLESRIVSNGGCSLTHVNMRCLGDFEEMSWLQVGSSRCELWKKQIGIGTRSDNLEVSYPPRPQYERGKLSAAQYGNKMRGFFFPLLFWLSCTVIQVCSLSKYC